MPTIEIAEVGPPPEWALWERQLLDGLYPAAVEFVRKYTRDDGTLIWRDRWPGMDGSDDGYESFYNFPLYYALGGPEEVNPLSRCLWEAVTRQFTRYGQIHNEFDAYYDWMHHGEAYTNLYFFGLADPHDAKYVLGRREVSPLDRGIRYRLDRADASQRRHLARQRGPGGQDRREHGRQVVGRVLRLALAARIVQPGRGDLDRRCERLPGQRRSQVPGTAAFGFSATIPRIPTNKTCITGSSATRWYSRRWCN